MRHGYAQSLCRGVSTASSVGCNIFLFLSIYCLLATESIRTFKYTVYQVCDNLGCIVNGVRIGLAEPEGTVVSPNTKIGNTFSQAYRELEGRFDATVCVNGRCSSVSEKMEDPLFRFINSTALNWDIDAFIREVDDFAKNNPYMGTNKTITQTKINRTTRSIRVLLCMNSNWTDHDFSTLCTSLNIASCTPKSCNFGLVDAFPELIDKLGLMYCVDPKLSSFIQICKIGCSHVDSCSELKGLLSRLLDVENEDRLENKFSRQGYSSKFNDCYSNECKIDLLREIVEDLLQNKTRPTIVSVKPATTTTPKQQTTTTQNTPDTTTKTASAPVSTTTGATVPPQTSQRLTSSQTEPRVTSTPLDTTTTPNYNKYCKDYPLVRNCSTILEKCRSNRTCIESSEDEIEKMNRIEEDIFNSTKLKICHTNEIIIPGCDDMITVDCYLRDGCLQEWRRVNESITKIIEGLQDLCLNLTREVPVYYDSCVENLVSCYNGTRNTSTIGDCVAHSLELEWDRLFKELGNYERTLRFCRSMDQFIHSCNDLFKTCKMSANCSDTLKVTIGSYLTMVKGIFDSCGKSLDFSQCVSNSLEHCTNQWLCAGNSTTILENIETVYKEKIDSFCGKLIFTDNANCSDTLTSCYLSSYVCEVEKKLLSNRDSKLLEENESKVDQFCQGLLFTNRLNCVNRLLNCSSQDCVLDRRNLIEDDIAREDEVRRYCGSDPTLDIVDCLSYISKSCTESDCDNGFQNLTNTHNVRLSQSKEDINKLCKSFLTFPASTCEEILLTFCINQTICSIGISILKINEQYNIKSFCSLIPEVGSEKGNCTKTLSIKCSGNDINSCNQAMLDIKEIAVKKLSSSEVLTRRSCNSIAKLPPTCCMESFRVPDKCEGGYWCFVWDDWLKKLNKGGGNAILQAACTGFWSIDKNLCNDAIGSCQFVSNCGDELEDFENKHYQNVSGEGMAMDKYCGSQMFVEKDICSSYLPFACAPRRICEKGKDTIEEVAKNKTSNSKDLSKLTPEAFCEPMKFLSTEECLVGFTLSCSNNKYSDCYNLQVERRLEDYRKKVNLTNIITGICFYIESNVDGECMSKMFENCQNKSSCEKYLEELRKLKLSQIEVRKENNKAYCDKQEYLPKVLCLELLEFCVDTTCAEEMDTIDKDRQAVEKHSVETVKRYCKMLNISDCSVYLPVTCSDRASCFNASKERIIDVFMDPTREKVSRRKRRAAAAPVVRSTTKYSSFNRALPIITGAIYKNNEVCISHMMDGGYKTLCICGVDMLTRTCYSEADTESVTCIGSTSKPSRAFINCNGQETGRYIAVKPSEIEKGTVIYLLEKVTSIETWRLWFGDAFVVILSILLILGFFEMIWLAIMYLFGWNSKLSKCFLTALLVTVCCIRPTSADPLPSVSIERRTNPIDNLSDARSHTPLCFLIPLFVSLSMSMFLRLLDKMHIFYKTERSSRPNLIQHYMPIATIVICWVYYFVSSFITNIIMGINHNLITPNNRSLLPIDTVEILGEFFHNENCNLTGHNTYSQIAGNGHQSDTKALANQILSGLIGFYLYLALKRILTTTQIICISILVMLMNKLQGTYAMDSIVDDPTPVTITSLFAVPVLVFLNGIKNYYLRTYFTKKYRANMLVYFNRELHPCNCNNVVWLLKTMENDMISNSTNLCNADKRILMDCIADGIVLRRVPATIDFRDALPVNELDTEVPCYAIIPDYSETSVENLQAIMKRFCIFNRYCLSKIDSCGSIYCEACSGCSDRFLINCVPRITHLICQLKKNGTEYEVYNPCLGRLRGRKSIISWRMPNISDSECDNPMSHCLKKVKDIASELIGGKKRALAYRALVSLHGLASDKEFSAAYSGWEAAEGEHGTIKAAITHEFELDSVSWKVKRDLISSWSNLDRECKVSDRGKQVTFLPPINAVSELASIRLPIESWEQDLVANTPVEKKLYPNEKFLEQIVNKINRILIKLRTDVKNFSYELCEDLSNYKDVTEYKFSQNVNLVLEILKKSIVGYLSSIDIESVILESDGLKPGVRKPLRMTAFTDAILDCEYFKAREFEVVILINEYSSKCTILAEELTSIFLVRKFFVLPAEPTVVFEEVSALKQLIESTIDNVSHTMAVWLYDAEVRRGEMLINHSELETAFKEMKELYKFKEHILKYFSFKKFLSPTEHCNCCEIKKSLERICEHTVVNDHLRDNDRIRYSHTLRKWYVRCGGCNHIVDLGFYNMSHHGQIYNIRVKEVADDINISADLKLNSSSTSDQVAKFWCHDKDLGVPVETDDLAFNSDENAAETLSCVPACVEASVGTFRQDPKGKPYYSVDCPREYKLDINPKSICSFSGEVEDWSLNCVYYKGKSMFVLPKKFLSVERSGEFTEQMVKEDLPENLKSWRGEFYRIKQTETNTIVPEDHGKGPIEVIKEIVNHEISSSSELIGSRSGDTEVVVYKRQGRKTMVKSKPNYVRVTRLTSIFDVLLAIFLFFLCFGSSSGLDCVGCEDYPFAQEESFWRGVPSSSLSIVNADVPSCTVTDSTQCELVATLTSISSRLPFENLFILSKSAAVNGQQEKLPQLVVSIKTLEPVTPVLYDQLYWVDQAIIDKISARHCCCGHDNICAEQNPFPQNITYRSNCLTMEVCGCAGCSCGICYNGIGACWYKIDLIDDSTTKEIVFKKQPKQPQVLTVAVRISSIGLEGTSSRGRRFCKREEKIYGMYGISDTGKMCQMAPVFNKSSSTYTCLVIEGFHDAVKVEECELCYSDTLLFPVKEPGCDSYCFVSPFEEVICYKENSTKLDFDTTLLHGEEPVVKLLSDQNINSCTTKVAYLDIKGLLSNTTISGANCTYWCKRSNRLVSCLDEHDHIQISPGCCEIEVKSLVASINYQTCNIRKCQNTGNTNFDKVEIIDLLPQVQSKLKSLNVSLISAFEMDQSIYPDYLVFRSGILHTGPSGAFPPRGLSTCGGPAMYHKYDNQFYYPSSDCVTLTKLDWSHAELSVPNQFSYSKSAQFFLLSEGKSFTYTMSRDYKYLTTYYSGQKLLSTMTLQMEMPSAKITLYRSKPKAIDLQCLANQKVCYNCGQTQVVVCCIDNVGGTGQSTYTIDDKEYSTHIGQGFSCYNLMAQLTTDKSVYKVCMDGVCRDVSVEFYKVTEGDNRFYGVQTQVKSIQGGAFGDFSVLAISLVAIGAAILSALAALTSLTLCGVLCPCCPCISKFALMILSILSFLCFCSCCKNKICCCFKRPGYQLVEKAAKKTEEKVEEIKSVPSERRPLFPSRSRLRV